MPPPSMREALGPLSEGAVTVREAFPVFRHAKSPLWEGTGTAKL